jgi:hypothetical protein
MFRARHILIASGRKGSICNRINRHSTTVRNPNRRIFTDDEHERQFARDGYVKLRPLAAHVVARIGDFFLSHSDPGFSGFHHSLELESPGLKAEIHRFLAQVFEEHWGDAFDHHRAVSGTFVTKKDADPGSVVQPHQDWSFVDETAYRSLNLWSPLCATNTENGALGLVAGSHRLPPGCRGTNIRPQLAVAQALKQLTFFNMQAGDVLAYDHRVIHASGANRSGRIRTAMSINVIPAEATPIHYVGDKHTPGRVVVLDVDDAFFHNYRMDMTTYRDPSSNQSVASAGYTRREFEHTPMAITTDMLERLQNTGGRSMLGRLKDRLFT